MMLVMMMEKVMGFLNTDIAVSGVYNLVLESDSDSDSDSDGDSDISDSSTIK